MQKTKLMSFVAQDGRKKGVKRRVKKKNFFSQAICLKGFIREMPPAQSAQQRSEILKSNLFPANVTLGAHDWV